MAFMSLVFIGLFLILCIAWLAYLSYAHYIPDYAEKMQLLIDYGADVNRRTYWCGRQCQRLLRQNGTGRSP